jgi:hypothetical protein
MFLAVDLKTLTSGSDERGETRTAQAERLCAGACKGVEDRLGLMELPAVPVLVGSSCLHSLAISSPTSGFPLAG